MKEIAKQIAASGFAKDIDVIYAQSEIKTMPLNIKRFDTIKATDNENETIDKNVVDEFEDE